MKHASVNAKTGWLNRIETALRDLTQCLEAYLEALRTATRQP